MHLASVIGRLLLAIAGSRLSPLEEIQGLFKATFSTRAVPLWPVLRSHSATVGKRLRPQAAVKMAHFRFPMFQPEFILLLQVLPVWRRLILFEFLSGPAYTLFVSSCNICASATIHFPACRQPLVQYDVPRTNLPRRRHDALFLPF